MVFWMAVAAGALFAWMAVRIGFFASWIMFFNLVLSAYVAIFLSPVIIASIPVATETSYGYALVFLSTATATLLIAYAACYACLSGRLRIEFPRVFDGLAAGLLGFLSGFLVWSFVGLSICLTPLPEMDSLKPLGFGGPAQETNTSFVCWWCDRLHNMVKSSDTDLTSGEAVQMLREEAGPRAASTPNPNPAGAATSSPSSSKDWPDSPGQGASGATRSP